ncbi:Hypp8008 [Branchiostoma lanceolatum]|uniref:Hypp8008 protein n=1 Tax=Branchiostoma lanceolatum TaxID=7740 RepID=A0A8J9Z5X9_BRALA|nr:Hypp8008 [Branchiostoma lanceolatum]
MASREDSEDTEEDFTYDAAVYCEEDDSKKADILDIRARLEDDRWGLTLCDPYRDGDGTQMGRFEHSAKNSRHAVVFLSPSLLERIEKKQENHSQFRVETFLCSVLDRRDTTLKRRVVPVMFEREGAEKPFILSGYTPLCPREVGFWRTLYRTLSRLPVPDAFTSQVSERVRNVKNLQLEAVLHIAAKLGLPEEVMDDIKVEYGGSQAMLRKVFYCWKAHLGPEATIDAVDDVIREATCTPQQVQQGQPQSLVGFTSAVYSDPTSPVVMQPSSACPSMQEPQLPSSMLAPPGDTPDTHTEPPPQGGTESSQGFKDTDIGVVDGPSNTTDGEDLSAGLRTLNLNTQQSCDQDKGEPEKKKTVAGFFRSLSLRATSSTQEKKKVYEEKTNDGNTKQQKRPSLGRRLRRSLSGRKRPALELA